MNEDVLGINDDCIMEKVLCYGSALKNKKIDAKKNKKIEEDERN